MLAILLDPGRLTRPDQLACEADAVLAYVRSSTPLDPAQPVMVAGEPELRASAERLGSAGCRSTRKRGARSPRRPQPSEWTRARSSTAPGRAPPDQGPDDPRPGRALHGRRRPRAHHGRTRRVVARLPGARSGEDPGRVVALRRRGAGLARHAARRRRHRAPRAVPRHRGLRGRRRPHRRHRRRASRHRGLQRARLRHGRGGRSRARADSRPGARYRAVPRGAAHRRRRRVAERSGADAHATRGRPPGPRGLGPHRARRRRPRQRPGPRDLRV